ncbi:hypothetical protein AB0I53_31415 [Saccharopolyspora sp. NPDC050389]|uniref:hypothetical protein n=1 Tax=Saccharopolyspora sp. NPDC050389 TaxID=3155516 RepID=UPI0033D6F7B9
MLASKGWITSTAAIFGLAGVMALQRGLVDGGRALAGNDENFLNDVRKSIDAAEPLPTR